MGGEGVLSAILETAEEELRAKQVITTEAGGFTCLSNQVRTLTSALDT